MEDSLHISYYHSTNKYALHKRKTDDTADIGSVTLLQLECY